MYASHSTENLCDFLFRTLVSEVVDFGLRVRIEDQVRSTEYATLK